jgi:hypothetical protein
MTDPVSAYTEQPAPAPKSASDNSFVSAPMWMVLILCLVLLVLLAWQRIDEMSDGSGGSDNTGNWFPPL